MNPWKRLQATMRGVCPEGAEGQPFNPPATPQQVQAAEDALGVRLPEDVREAYLHMDGAPALPWQPPQPRVPLFLPEGRWWSLAEMVAEWQGRHACPQPPTPWAEQPVVGPRPLHDARVQPEAVLRHRLPLSPGPFTVALDLAPGPRGQRGQVIVLSPGGPPQVLAPSFRDYVCRWLDLVDQRRIVLATSQAWIHPTCLRPVYRLEDAAALDADALAITGIDEVVPPSDSDPGDGFGLMPRLADTLGHLCPNRTTLNGPASAARLWAAERVLGLRFPVDVVQAYRWADGQVWPGKSGEPRLVAFMCDWAPLHQVVDGWRMHVEVAHGLRDLPGLWDEGVDPPDGTDPVAQVWYSPRRIPVGAYEAGAWCFVDMRPAPPGKSGQLVCLTHGGMPELRAPSLSSFWRQMLDAIDQGTLCWSAQNGWRHGVTGRHVFRLGDLATGGHPIP